MEIRRYKVPESFGPGMVSIPMGATILKASLYKGVVSIWAEVPDVDIHTIDVGYCLHGTGIDIPDWIVAEWTHVETMIEERTVMPLVFHLYMQLGKGNLVIPQPTTGEDHG